LKDNLELLEPDTGTGKTFSSLW